MKIPPPFLRAVLAVACAFLAGTTRAGTTSNLYVACEGIDNIQVLSTAGVRGAAIPVTSPAVPAAAAFDRAGNLYVANGQSPYSIQEYSPAGVSLGSFTTTTTNLNQPNGLAFDSAGNLYVANFGTNSIEKFSPAGVDLGSFVSTGLSGPVGLAFDLGNLYVVNNGNGSISEFSASGSVLKGTFTSSKLKSPLRIAFDSAHNFYVTDLATNSVEIFSSGVDVGVYASAGLNEPSGLAFDTDGTLYVCNANALNIEKISSSGVDQGSIGSLPSGAVAFDLALLAPGGQIAFSSATYQTSENAGAVTITVDRVGGSRGKTSVTYSTTDGTAKTPFDYSQTSGTLTWTDGDFTAQTFTVPVLDSGITTGASVNFMVALLSASGTGTLGMPASATVTIADNDVAPAGQLQFSSATYQTFEDAGSVPVTVSRVGGSNGAVSVSYATQDGTAFANTDYTAASGTLSWTSGDTADKTITVPLINRKLTSGSVAFGVSLSQAIGTTLGTPTAATVTISDNDKSPAGQIQFSSATYQTFEDAGSVTLTATRVGGTTGATSVTYSTTDGTAKAGTDYTTTGGTLSWADGDAADKTFQVSILDHAVTTAGSVSFSVNFLTVSGLATLGTPPTATVAITDNDTAPPAAGAIQFSAPSYATFEDARSVMITVSRVGGSSGPVSVGYATGDGTALAGRDYTAASGTLSWADGDANPKIIPVPILDRQITGATPLTFTVTLRAPTGGATLGNQDSATVSISDNDIPNQPTITLTAPANDAAFADGTLVTFSATVTDPANRLVQVQFFVDGELNATFSKSGSTYTSSTTFQSGGTHQIEAVATGAQGFQSTSSATVTVYEEPILVGLESPPASITILTESLVDFEAGVFDPGNQIRGVQFALTGIGGGLISGSDEGNSYSANQAFEFPGTYQLQAILTALDGTTSTSAVRTITVVNPTGTAVSAASATFVAALDHVNVTAAGALSVFVMTTSVVDRTGATVPAVTRVDFYANGVLFASRDGNGNPIALSARAPGRGPITRAAAANLGTHLFEAVYQVLSDLKPVTITAVATTSDGLSQLTAPLHVTPVVETGTPPVAILGPLTGSQPIPAGAGFAVPVTVSAPSIPVAMVQYYLNGALVSAATAPPYSVTVTPPIAGPYALTAVVTDANGVATFAEPLAFQAVPTVSVAVKGDGMAIVGGEIGKVVFTRTGDDLSAPLTVYFKPTGAAKDGVNFRDVGRQVVIPAGASSAKLKIKPLDTGTGPLALPFDLKLLPAPDGSYARGDKAKAKLTLKQTQ